MLISLILVTRAWRRNKAIAKFFELHAQNQEYISTSIWWTTSQLLPLKKSIELQLQLNTGEISP